MVARPGCELASMIEPVLGSMGYELVDIEYGAGGLLRVVIDIEGGTRHVRVEDCEKTSHHLGRLFTVEDVDYDRLEVSSPGLDRPLKKPGDFVRFAGEKVTLRMREPIDGRRQFTGVLQRADQDGGDRWRLYWSDDPVTVPGRKGAKGAKAGAKSGASGKGGARGGTKAGGMDGAAAGSGEGVAGIAVRPQGRLLEFTLEQVEKARLVPKVVF